MFKALFGKREDDRQAEEQALEIARSTLMNRVTQIIERSTTMQVRFETVGHARAVQH